MTGKHYLRLVIVLGVVFAGIFVFLPPKDAAGVAIAMAAMLGTILVGGLPGPKAFILRHRRGVAVAGWLLAASGVVLSVALDLNSDMSAMMPGVAVSVVGIALASLTRSLKATADAKDLPPPAQAKQLAGFGAGLDALAYPLRELRMSAAVLGPWVALFILAPIVVLTPVLGGADWIKHAGRDVAIAALLAIMGMMAVMYGALMIASIQWARFVKDGHPPPLEVPWRPLWSFAWRWFLFGSLSRVPSALGPWLAVHYPNLPNWASASLTSITGLAFLTLVSPMALVLPGLALREKDTSLAAAMASLRSVGRGFYLGALVVLTPFTLLSWVFDLLPSVSVSTWVGSALRGALLVAWGLSFFLSFPAAMTYLTRVHAAAHSRHA